MYPCVNCGTITTHLDEWGYPICGSCFNNRPAKNAYNLLSAAEKSNALGAEILSRTTKEFDPLIFSSNPEPPTPEYQDELEGLLHFVLILDKGI